jgi:hypothetical protein
LWWGVFVLWLLAVSIDLITRERKDQSDRVDESVADGTAMEANV